MASLWKSYRDLMGKRHEEEVKMADQGDFEAMRKMIQQSPTQTTQAVRSPWEDALYYNLMLSGPELDMNALRRVMPTPATPTRVEVELSVRELDRSLAEDAASVLGYTPLKTEMDKDEARFVLAAAFERLDIKPFDDAQVKTYKQAMADKGTSRYKIATWKEVLIKDYTQPIPMHILQRAVAVKKEVPGCDVYVDYLESVNLPDPFLVVKMSGACFYIDVWDEPQWESRDAKK